MCPGLFAKRAMARHAHTAPRRHAHRTAPPRTPQRATLAARPTAARPTGRPPLLQSAAQQASEARVETLQTAMRLRRELAREGANRSLVRRARERLEPAAARFERFHTHRGQREEGVGAHAIAPRATGTA